MSTAPASLMGAGFLRIGDLLDICHPETRAQKHNQCQGVGAPVTIRNPGTGPSFPKCPHLFPLFFLEVLEFLWWLSQ